MSCRRAWPLRSRAARRIPRLGAVAATLALLATGCAPSGPSSGPSVGSAESQQTIRHRQFFGAFLGSDDEGVRRIPGFDRFLGVRTQVGHTYLPGETWRGIEGPDFILEPWARWRAQNPESLFVLNVPLVAPNEANLSDDEVAARLRDGADGAYDKHFAVLARRLVQLKLQDAVLVPGWEMNGITYSHRCGPAPEVWKAYYRRVVTTMRATPGQDFVFDFTTSRGTDAIAWPACYPGDDVVDIIGMDSYDQPPGEGFLDYVQQPNGLQDQVDFAAAHGKPVSYPEWGLFRNGDNPAFIRDMHDWITTNDTVYSTLTDYCPHGVFWCSENPNSAQAVRELFGAP